MRFVCAFLLALCLTTPAHAATISSAGGVVTIQDAPGIRTGMMVSTVNGALSIQARSDPAFTPPTIGSGCFAGAPWSCPLPTRVEADLLDGDDELLGGFTVSARVDAGLGDDYIQLSAPSGALDGGDGNDTLSVSAAVSSVAVDGGRDDDKLYVVGGQDVRGGDGNDIVKAQTDVAAISLDDQPNDTIGLVAGGNFHSDIESLVTGVGDDIIIGRAGPNVLDAGAGDDELTGGPARDTLIGGSDDDLLHAADGAVDTIDCGPGRDRVFADVADAVTGCESVFVDADHDSVFSDTDCDDTNATIRPGAAEIAGNGVDEDCDRVDLAKVLPRVDADRDGVSPPEDCNDANPTVRLGAREIPGNTIDENCDSVAEPFPRIRGTVAYGFLTEGGRTRVLKLRIGGAPAGASVSVTCTGGGCPRGKLKPGTIKGGTLELKRLFKGRLAAGAVVEVRVTAPEWIGEVKRFTTRRGKKEAKVTALCVLPGANRPAGCAGA